MKTSDDISSTSLSLLSDEALVARVEELAGRERGATAQLIASLIELDVRKLFLGQGCPLLFIYCTEVLCLSEHAAYGRITACRATKRFPLILDRLADGSITLTTVCLLSAHLTPENHRELLESVRYKSRRDVERLLAGRRQQSGTALAEGPEPMPPALEHDTVTLTDATHDKRLWARDLLRHTVPSGDLALVVDRALTDLIADLERAKAGVGSTRSSGAPQDATSQSRSGARCGPGMAGDVRSSGPRGAARSGDSRARL
jgi:hypothetical protein